MPIAVRSPSTAALRSRSSIGSISSSRATSSMTDSMAKAACGADGARYAADLGVLVSAV